MDFKFNPTDETIEKILTTGFYQIPRYQREYSWDLENISDLWNDLKKSADGGLFLGHIVTQTRDASTRDVIDGQQRLTTIAIALKVVENKFYEYGDSGRAEGVRQYIEGTDKSGKPSFRIKQLSEAGLVQLNVFAREPEKYSRKVNLTSSEERQRDALNQFHSLIDQELSERTGEDPIAVLEQIRERFLQAHAIVVEGTDRRSAFALFETLNDRGKSLTQMDLVKNEIMSSVPETAENSAERSWAEAIELLESTDWKPQINQESFLFYVWNSCGYQQTDEIVKTERLRKSVSEWFDESGGDREANADLLVATILKTAKIFKEFNRTLEAPNGEHWHPLAEEYGRSRNKRKWYDIDQALYGCLVPQSVLPLQLIFSLLRKHMESDRSPLKQKVLLEFLECVASFQFRWSVSQKPSTDTVRRMYRRSAYAVQSADSPSQIQDALARFKDDANGLMATDAQFKDGLKKMTYFDKRPEAVHRVRYFLETVEAYWGDSHLPSGMEQMTIEHIEPQSGISITAPNKQWIGKLGNLMLLPSVDNSDIGSGTFGEKLSVLSRFANESDIVLMEALNDETWSNANSNERMDELCEAAFDIWPLEL